MSHPTMADMASRTMAKKKNWVKKATAGAHGQFRAKAEAAGKSTREFAKEHESDSGKTGQQARLAETLIGMSHKRKKLYTHPRS